MFLNQFDIKLPIIQAPMAGVQDSRLAIAVANAGGLGSVPCGTLEPDALQAELEAVRGGTDRPVNFNFFCHTPPTPNPAVEERWRTVLQPYFDEFDLTVDDIKAGMGRRPFNHEIADVLEPFRPAIVSFHFGLPERSLLERVKGWGGLVLSTATTIDEALWLDANGADVIIAQGLEAGGHRGHFMSTDLNLQMGTLALVPQIVAKVERPVIAAGGIGDATGVRAALALGAEATQIGTAYLLCPEAETSPIHRAALKSRTAHQTALTNLFSGGVARGIVNRVMREIGPLSAAAPPYPLAAAALTTLRRRVEQNGSGDFSPLWSGQNNSGCREVPAGLLTKRLASGR